MFKKRRFGLVKNFSVPARLHTAGFLALMGIAATCYAGFVGLKSSDHGLTTSLTATTAVLNQKHADMMHDAIRSDVLYALYAGANADPALRDEITHDLDMHIADFEAAFVELEGLDLPADIEQGLAAAETDAQEYFAAAREVMATAFTGQGANPEAFPNFMVYFSKLEESMEVLGEDIEAHGQQAGVAALKDNATYGDYALMAGGIAALVLIVSNFLLARSITKPLQRVKVAIQEVAGGNLGGRFSNFDRVSDLRDEVSEIAHYLEIVRIRLREALEMEAAIKRSQEEQTAVVSALSVGLENLSGGVLTKPITTPFPADYEGLRTNFNNTLEQLNDTIGQVVKASVSIRSRSDEMSEASSELATRTQNQAATLEETAAALDELTSSVKSAANSAKEVEKVVTSARIEAERNGEVVQRAVDAIQGIARSSEQITQIIGVIDDIAFQTNLLALNAGVEAARAGESGRGFAVVASEVRSLAQRSSEASKEIKELIVSSGALVSRGVEAVGLAGQSLTSVFERVSHISTLVSGIAEGAAQQSVALGEVNIGMNDLDMVTQRNAAMVEQSTATTQSLQQDALGMDSLMARFVTKSTPQTGDTGPVAFQPQRRVAGMR